MLCLAFTTQIFLVVPRVMIITTSTVIKILITASLVMLQEDERLQQALNLEHMQGAFYLLCLGVALAFHALIVELVVTPQPTASD